MEVDKEYYSNQVEYKTRSLPLTIEDISRSRDAIKSFADDPIV